MRFNYHYAFLLLLPLLAQTSCSTDDDTSSSGAGSGGRSQAGAAGNAGRSSGGSGGSAHSAGSSGVIDAAGSDSDTEAGSGGTGDAGAAGNAGEGGAAGAVEVALEDSELVKVVTTLNNGEIAAGQVALSGAQAAAVKTYAQTMVTDHSAANTQVLALVATKHIAPRPSSLSEKLESEAASLLVKLSATTTASFDATYIESQIHMHQEALSLIDSKLIPAASDASLKTLLGNVRASVEAHLTQAQTVQASL